MESELTQMSWSGAFTVLFILIGFALIFHGWPEITINRHFHNGKKEKTKNKD